MSDECADRIAEQSDLRDRIAAAIYNACDEYTRKLIVRPDLPGASELEGDGKPVCYVLADAVIRELGLQREGQKSRTVTNEHGATYHIQGGHRYVTKWIDSQTNVKPRTWGCGDERCKACY